MIQPNKAGKLGRSVEEKSTVSTVRKPREMNTVTQLSSSFFIKCTTPAYQTVLSVFRKCLPFSVNSPLEAPTHTCPEVVLNTATLTTVAGYLMIVL